MKYIDQLIAVDVRKWKRNGYLESGVAFTSSYFLGGKLVHSFLVRAFQNYLLINKQRVAIVLTPNTFGGDRSWFSCPACQRKCAKLYFSKRLTCQKCTHLTYSSQNEGAAPRAIRRSRKIRHKLGADRSILVPITNKPRYMHWNTFYRLVSKADAAENIQYTFLQKQLASQ